jgi:hypothetical protein
MTRSSSPEKISIIHIDIKLISTLQKISTFLNNGFFLLFFSDQIYQDSYCRGIVRLIRHSIQYSKNNRIEDILHMPHVQNDFYISGKQFSKS